MWDLDAGFTTLASQNPIATITSNNTPVSSPSSWCSLSLVLIAEHPVSADDSADVMEQPDGHVPCAVPL